MDDQAVPVVSYARISADTTKDEHGVTDQYKVNRETAARLGWVVVYEIADNDWSASKLGVVRAGSSSSDDIATCHIGSRCSALNRQCRCSTSGSGCWFSQTETGGLLSWVDVAYGHLAAGPAQSDSGAECGAPSISPVTCCLRGPTMRSSPDSDLVRVDRNRPNLLQRQLALQLLWEPFI